MSENFNPNYGPTPPPVFAPTPQPKSKARWVLPAALLVGGLVLGGAVGVSAKPNVTPDSCIKALDYANEGFEAAADAIGAATDGMKAASRLSSSGIRDAGYDMDNATEKITDVAPKYKSSQQECRDSK